MKWKHFVMKSLPRGTIKLNDHATLLQMIQPEHFLWYSLNSIQFNSKKPSFYMYLKYCEKFFLKILRNFRKSRKRWIDCVCSSCWIAIEKNYNDSIWSTYLILKFVKDDSTISPSFIHGMYIRICKYTLENLKRD